MEVFLRFDISFFSVALLLLIFITIRLRNDTRNIAYRLFQRLIFINILMLMLEVVSWQFDGLPGTFNYYTNYISNMLFAWSAPLITCFWCAYIDYHMFHSMDRIKRRWFYLQPMMINTLFITINFFTPFIFSVDQNNVYSREPFMWLIVVLNTTVLGYVWYQAYLHRREINREVVIAILTFVGLPAAAAVLQVAIYGVFILWPTMAVTIVITYIFLETVSTERDYLTGLASRQRVDDYIEFMLKSEGSFSLMMIDLNDFKQINDIYGHTQGDRALKFFSQALKDVFSDHKLVGRFAGDEFVVISDELDDIAFDFHRQLLEGYLKNTVTTFDLEYDLAFSIGYMNSYKDSGYDYEKLIKLTDMKMHEDKRKKNEE